MIIAFLSLFLAFVQADTTSQVSKLVDKALAVVNQNPDSGYYYYRQAFHLAEDSLLSVRAQAGMGMALQFQSDYDSALGYYEEALGRSRANGFDHETGSILSNVGALYMGLGKFEESQPYFDEAHDLMVAAEDTLWLSRIVINLAGVAYMTGDKSTSLERLKFAARISQSAGLDQTVAGAYANLAIVYTELEKYDSAIAYVDLGIEMLVEQQKDRDVALAMYQKANLLHSIGRHADALQAVEETRGIADRLGFKKVIMDLAILSSQINEALGDNERALSDARMALQWSDSVFNQQTAEAVEKLSTEYEVEKKDQEITILSQEAALHRAERNVLWAGAASLLVIAGLLGYLYWMNRRSKTTLEQKNKAIAETLEEREVLLREIHHRVKNNLQIVSSLLNVQSRFLKTDSEKQAIQAGRDRVISMALVHQKLYEGQNLSKVDVAGYVQQLTETIFSSYNIDRDRISCDMDIESVDLDTDTAIYLGLMINELISNALKHAFPDEVGGTISVCLKKEADKLELEVSDNGVGGKVDKTESYGSRLINSLARGLGAEVLEKSEQGTSVSIIFEAA